MYRSTKNNLFYLRLPVSFVPKEIDDKYSTLLKLHQCPFKSVVEFLNSLIINVSFPSVDYEMVTQEHARAPRNYRGGTDVHRAFSKQIDIDIRLTEGYLSYFMFYDLFMYWNDNEDVSNKYINDLVVKTLDIRGNEMATLEYKEVLLKSVGELNLSFSENDPSFKNFTVTFLSNILDINILNKIKQ